MQKNYSFFLLLALVISACSPAQTAAAPTQTVTLPPSLTSIPIPTPVPVSMVEIDRLGGGEMLLTLVGSPDGLTYAVGGNRGIHLFDTSTKQEIGFFPGWVRKIQYSPNSQLIGAEGSSTKLIRLSDGKELGEFPNWFYTFSPDSKLFAYLTTCGHDDTYCKESIHIWDITTQREILEIKAEKAGFSFLHFIFDPTSTLLLVAGPGGLIYVSSARSGATKFKLSGHANAAQSLAFSHNGKTMASFGIENEGFKILLWDWNSKKIYQTITGGQTDYPRSLQFSADDSQLHIGYDGDLTLVYDLAAGKFLSGDKFVRRKYEFITQRLTRAGRSNAIGHMAYSPDGQTLAVGSRNSSLVVLWDLRTMKLKVALNNSGTFLKYTHDGKHLIVLKAPFSYIGLDAEINIWDTSTNTKLRTFKVPSAMTFDISPDDSILAVDGSHAIQLWDIEKGVLVRSLATPADLDGPYSVSYAADGKSIHALLYKDLDYSEVELSVRAWDALTGDLLPAPIQPIKIGIGENVLALRHDMLALFQYTPKRTLVLWDLESGKKLPPIAIDKTDPDLFFAPNEQAAALIDHGRVTFYDIRTGAQVYDHNSAEDEFQEVPAIFAPDGDQLAIWDKKNDGIRLWDLSGLPTTPVLTQQATVMPDVTVMPQATATPQYIKTQCLKALPNPPANFELHENLLFSPIKGNDFISDLRKQRVIRTLDGSVYTTSISPDGKWLIEFSGSTISLIIESTDGKQMINIPWDNRWIGDPHWADNEHIMFHIIFDGKNILEVPSTVIINPFTGEQRYLPSSDYPDMLRADKNKKSIFNFEHSNVIYNPLLTRALYKQERYGQTPPLSLVLWDMQDGKAINTLNDFKYEPTALWSAADEKFIITMRPATRGSVDDGTYIENLFSIDPGGDVEQLTHFEDVYSPRIRFSFVTPSPNGEKIAFWLDQKDPKTGDDIRSDLFVLDLKTRALTKYCFFDMPPSKIRWSRNGHFLMIGEYGFTYLIDLQENWIVQPFKDNDAYLIGFVAEP